MADTTRLLKSMQAGSAEAREQLLPIVYAELRQIAGSLFRDQRRDHTLQPTALVHEAWLRLVDATSLGARDRSHFFAIAATAMRQVMVDHARAKAAAKRGGGMGRVALEGLDVTVAAAENTPEEIVALDEVLGRLSRLDARQAQVVEMRVFGGLTVDQVGEALGVSPRTVELDWRSARAWLTRELTHG